MKSAWQINARRLALLMRNDILSQSRPILLTAGAAFSFLFVAWGISLFTGHSHDFYPFFFGATVLMGGIVLTSLSFSELHHGLKGIAYLTLPGSLVEKYISKLVLTSVGFAGATVVFFYLFSLVAALIARLAFGNSMPVFDVTADGIAGYLITFLTIHPLVFFGGIYFKRLALVKTLLCVFSFLIGLGIVMLFVGWPLFAGIDGAVAMHNLFSNLSEFFRVHGRALAAAGKMLTRFVMPVFFIGLGYLRLTEYEVNNGV
ncbi:MAG: hypothetical protein GF410_08155 [Chitinivibrionales bacterium]|nr:hypothetical protein [Chitinivibrionales bacterium]